MGEEVLNESRREGVADEMTDERRFVSAQLDVSADLEMELWAHFPSRRL